jgi:hypothetical protein
MSEKDVVSIEANSEVRGSNNNSRAFRSTAGEDLPSENYLLQFRLLLFSKLSVYALQTCLFLVLAIISSHNRVASVAGKRSWDSEIEIFSISACACLLAAVWSFRHHTETWRSNLSLQCILWGWAFVLAIRTRTEWAQNGLMERTTMFAILVGTVYLNILSALLEGVPRITNKRVKEVKTRLWSHISSNTDLLLSESYIS